MSDDEKLVEHVAKAIFDALASLKPAQTISGLPIYDMNDARAQARAAIAAFNEKRPIRLVQREPVKKLRATYRVEGEAAPREMVAVLHGKKPARVAIGRVPYYASSAEVEALQAVMKALVDAKTPVADVGVLLPPGAEFELWEEEGAEVEEEAAPVLLGPNGAPARKG